MHVVWPILPHHVLNHFTGKGLDIRPLEDVKKFLANQSISVRDDRDTFGPFGSDSWSQVLFDVIGYNQVRTVYKSAYLYDSYDKFSIFKSTSNPNELYPSSPRVTDFTSASLYFDPEHKVTSDYDNSGQKVILGTAIHLVARVSVFSLTAPRSVPLCICTDLSGSKRSHPQSWKRYLYSCNFDVALRDVSRRFLP